MGYFVNQTVEIMDWNKHTNLFKIVKQRNKRLSEYTFTYRHFFLKRLKIKQ